MSTTIDDCRIIELGRHHGSKGNLTEVENGKIAGFDTERVFFIYDIPGGASVIICSIALYAICATGKSIRQRLLPQ